MGDYFKPLRRKIGVVTLLMACIVMSVKIAALRSEAALTLPIGSHFLLLATDKEIWIRINGEPIWSDDSLLLHSDLVRVTVSYFMLVVPLILLSVWLLSPRIRFSAKPRTKYAPPDY